MITKPMATFLTAVQNGQVAYSQFTGAFGARYENTATGRKINHHDERSSLNQAIKAKLITDTTLAERMGGPLRKTLTLTEAGKAALAERNG